MRLFPSARRTRRRVAGLAGGDDREDQVGGSVEVLGTGTLVGPAHRAPPAMVAARTSAAASRCAWSARQLTEAGALDLHDDRVLVEHLALRRDALALDNLDDQVIGVEDPGVVGDETDAVVNRSRESAGTRPRCTRTGARRPGRRE